MCVSCACVCGFSIDSCTTLTRLLAHFYEHRQTEKHKQWPMLVAALAVLVALLAVAVMRSHDLHDLCVVLADGGGGGAQSTVRTTTKTTTATATIRWYKSYPLMNQNTGSHSTMCYLHYVTFACAFETTKFFTRRPTATQKHTHTHSKRTDTRVRFVNFYTPPRGIRLHTLYILLVMVYRCAGILERR